MDILYVGTLPPHTGGSAVVGGALVGGWAARGNRVRAIAPVTPADAGALAELAPLETVRVRRYEVPRYDVTSQETGLVLIASDFPGSREVVTHGHDGLLHPVGDVRALAVHLTAAAGDAAERARLGAAARSSIEPHDLGRVIDRYLEVLRLAAATGQRSWIEQPGRASRQGEPVEGRSR